MESRGTISKKEIFIILGIMAVYFLHRLVLYKLGIYMEECRDANAMVMALNGKVPYRDFHFWVYGPFVFCIYPMIFKIFGISLEVFRLGYVTAGSLVIPLVYILARRLMTPFWAAISTFLGFVLIDVPYYTYNHIYATIGGLAAILLVIKFIEERRTSYLFLAGVFVGLALLVKPFIMGFGTLAACMIFLFLMRLRAKEGEKTRPSRFLLLLAASGITVAPFAAYFAAHGCLGNLITEITPFGTNRVGSFYVYNGPGLPGFPFDIRTQLAFFLDMIPYKMFLQPSEWKAAFATSYYRLVLYAPILVTAVILLLNKFIFRKYNLVGKARMAYLLFFSMFSIFICLQTFLVHGSLGRSFTSQVSFIIIVFFLSLINNKSLYQRAFAIRFVMGALTVFFVLYLSLLHFFIYPVSRARKYNVPLGFARAQTITVTPEEKTLYEALRGYLQNNSTAEEPIAVLGYYPQIAFLLERENIFGDMEDMWIKFMVVADAKVPYPSDMRGADESEKLIIERFIAQKPRIVISPVVTERRYIPIKVAEYLNKNYRLEKTLGPADIDIYTPGIVNVYQLKKRI